MTDTKTTTHYPTPAAGGRWWRLPDGGLSATPPPDAAPGPADAGDAQQTDTQTDPALTGRKHRKE